MVKINCIVCNKINVEEGDNICNDCEKDSYQNLTKTKELVGTKEDKIVEAVRDWEINTEDGCAHSDELIRKAIRLTIKEMLKDIDEFNDSFDCYRALHKSCVWSASNDDVCDIAREVTIKELKLKLQKWIGEGDVK